jgi:Spy/CpxP family protein refolding chaperone
MLAIAAASCAAGPGVAPYAGQEVREIKALAPDEVSSLLAGRGMGLAKAAEFNGYPGPLHVLELADRLQLSGEQREKTQALFASMQAKAMSLGRALVEEERALDRLFAGKAATAEQVSASLARIGALQAQVRGAHLEAHLAQVLILTPEQNAKYVEFRGYGDPAARDSAAAHRH